PLREKFPGGLFEGWQVIWRDFAKRYWFDRLDVPSAPASLEGNAKHWRFKQAKERSRQLVVLGRRVLPEVNAQRELFRTYAPQRLPDEVVKVVAHCLYYAQGAEVLQRGNRRPHLVPAGLGEQGNIVARTLVLV